MSPTLVGVGEVVAGVREGEPLLEAAYCARPNRRSVAGSRVRPDELRDSALTIATAPDRPVGSTDPQAQAAQINALIASIFGERLLSSTQERGPAVPARGHSVVQ
jgi:hypothetical protein